MNYPEAVKFLYELQLFGAKFGLATTRRLAELAGRPQDQLRFIHVAGTNGKGSVCAFLESIYRHAGLRVGLYTSPHLVSFRERIQINRVPISESETVELVEEMKRIISKKLDDVLLLPSGEGRGEGPVRGDAPTFFEVVTVMALQYFADRKCDLVIWETGLGGRLDATNIVTPLASVITNIQLDHQRWLGQQTSSIAVEKAGIIKPQVPVITGTTDPAALEVIRLRAAELSSPLIEVGSANIGENETNEMNLSLQVAYQRQNAAVACATVRTLQSQIEIRSTTIAEGLMSARWPGRFQIVRRDGRIIVLDGAHNPDGMRALRMALGESFPNKKPAVIFGVMADKNVSEMCEQIAAMASRVVICPVQSNRSAAVDDILAYFRRFDYANAVTVPTSTAALHSTSKEPFVVIAGSLYLIGEALELLNLAPIPHSDERRLNDWLPSRPNRQ